MDELCWDGFIYAGHSRILEKDLSSPESLITVILPHFKCEAYLYDAAASILAQDVPDLMLYVVDDCSPTSAWRDKLAPLTSDPRLALFQTDRNVGPYSIINRLVTMSRSPFIAFQDADDVSLPQRFSRQLALFNRTRADIVGTSFVYVDEAGRPLSAKKMVYNVNLWQRLGKKFVNLHATTLIRREVFDALGGFDTISRVGPDTEFTVRASYLFRIRNTSELLYHYRVRSDSLSQTRETGFGSDKLNQYVAIMQERKRRWQQTSNKTALRESLRVAPDETEFEVNQVS